AAVADVYRGREPGPGQGVAGAFGDGRVDLDRGHGVLAEAVRHEGGVVAGAGLDLQHAFAAGHAQRVEHVRHQAWLTRTRRRDAGDRLGVRVGVAHVVELGDQRPVAV